MTLLFRDSQDIDTFTPRILNSLNLCFNPMGLIPAKVSEITGLNNFLLEDQSKFTASTSSLLNAFLAHLPQPVVLVAHNGDKFDYPLLKSELNKVNSDLDPSILTIDSLPAMRNIFDEMIAAIKEEVQAANVLVKDGQFDTQMNAPPDVKKPCLDGNVPHGFKTPEKNRQCTTPKLPPRTNHSSSKRIASELLSKDRRRNGGAVKRKLNFDRPTSFSLPLLFKHVFGEEPNGQHGADIDVTNLMRVCATKSTAFVNYAEENATSFAEVKKMW